MIQIAAAIVLTLVTSTALCAAPPTDTEIGEKVQALYQYYKESKLPDNPTPEQLAEWKSGLEARAVELLGDIKVSELSDSALRGLKPLLTASPKHRAMVDALLVTKSGEKTIDGFSAACDRIEYASDDSPDASNKLVLAAIDHPAAIEAAKAGMLGSIAWYVSALPPSELTARGDRLSKMAQALIDSDAPAATSMAPTFLKSLSTALPKQQFEPLRLAAIASLAHKLESDEAKKDEKQAKYLKRGIDVLSGAAMRGELIDHQVPTITFRKVYGADATGGSRTTAAPWSTLADLKGKVVVLDFWATWCGPCVASFPHVKELRKQFSSDELEIVGITSLQGYVMSPDRKRIDCSGDPAKEEVEVANFLDAKGVTWTVAMSNEDVFNPEFGIQGIPHVAILDQNGVVRKAGLHPEGNRDEIIATINELLKKPAKERTTTSAAPTKN